MSASVTDKNLIASGFLPTSYEGQTGKFNAKKLLVRAMPYANEHLVDCEDIFPETEAVVEIFSGVEAGHLNPDVEHFVQMFITDADYVEGPHALFSEEGRALVADACDGKTPDWCQP